MLQEGSLYEVNIIYNQLEQKANLTLLKQLLLVRNVIYEQLPKMTKEYITRVIFDPNNKTIICKVKETGQIKGCLTFRIFEEIKMSELIFLTVQSDGQKGGIGTQLVNYFKSNL